MFHLLAVRAVLKVAIGGEQGRKPGLLQFAGFVLYGFKGSVLSCVSGSVKN